MELIFDKPDNLSLKLKLRDLQAYALIMCSGLPHPGKVLESPGFFFLFWKVLEFCS